MTITNNNSDVTNRQLPQSYREYRTATTEQDSAARPNPTELTEAELEKVKGGIIAILIGKSSSPTPVFAQPELPIY